MTRPMLIEKTCAVCNTKQSYMTITSTSAVGSPDLDMRPPPVERSTIHAWVKRCRNCGYCASDLGSGNDGVAERVRSQEYQDQLLDANFPDLANSFLCKAMIEMESEQYDKATWSHIHAAWVCDDQRPELSIKCRLLALDSLKIAEQHNQEFTKDADTSFAIQVDLLRRAGQYDEALAAIQKGLEIIHEPVVTTMLEFQRTLIQKGDISCYTIADAHGEGFHTVKS